VHAAILKIAEDAWIASLATDGSQRLNGQVVEITTEGAQGISERAVFARFGEGRLAVPIGVKMAKHVCDLVDQIPETA
jgi:hypothetical protein